MSGQRTVLQLRSKGGDREVAVANEIVCPNSHLVTLSRAADLVEPFP